jgi:uncharacterized protein YsxB (DUF464 family)
MIKIDYEMANGRIISLIAQGHANYSEEGTDIVCSAVSGILLGGLNALQEQDKFSIKTEDGYVSIKVNKQINEHDNIVLETLLTQLKSVQTNYKKFIQIKRKE